MAVDHDRHSPHEYQDYIHRAPNYDASGWSVILGIAALMAILGMLFIGISRTPTDTTQQTTIERTAPTPAPTQTPTPAPSAPSTPN